MSTQISATDSPAVPPLVALVRTMRDCCQRSEGQMCRQLALSASEFACLLSMPVLAEEINVHRVAKTMGLSPSRTSRIVEALVRRGLLSRRTLESDRRKQMVALTLAGREKWHLAHQLLVECENHLLSRLGSRDSRELAATLKALINAW